MLRVVALAAAVWGIGTPIVLAIKTGDARLLLLAPLGLLLVPVAIVLAMFGRVLLWVHLVLFWYIRGALAAVSLLLFAGLSCALLLMPSQWMDQTAGRIADGLPSNALAVGAIVGVLGVALLGAYMMSRRARPPRRGEGSAQGGSLSKEGISSPASPPSSVPPLNPPAARPLTYLQHRQGKDSP